MHSGALLGASRGHSSPYDEYTILFVNFHADVGIVLGVLGASWEPLGHLLGFLGASWEFLRGFWRSSWMPLVIRSCF